MNWVDILLGVIVLFAVVIGWERGFILGLLGLASWVGSLLLAFIFYPYTARLLDGFLNIGVWLLPVAFLLTAAVAMALIGFFTRLVARTIPNHVNNSVVNKFLGIIPGLINGWVYVVVISAFLLALPLSDGITADTRESRLGGRLALQAEWANRRLAPVFDEAIRQTMNSLTVRPGTDKSVGLPFKYTKATARPDLESEMLEMINEERAEEGLPPLRADAELTPVARAHSRDMFARGYFAHVSPDGKNPFDRMKEANISFEAAGENLALAQTLKIAHINLMNSPGHRANILNPSFGRVGIGILDGGLYGLMISQEFRN